MPQALNTPPPRRFNFERDAFAFANELVCEYVFDPAGGRPKMVAKAPRPEFALRCFPLVRAARQFLYHAEFLPQGELLGEAECRQRIREVLSRNPRISCGANRRVLFPGYNGLRSFSQAWEKLLKTECGGARRSYVLRSHWRMVLPISRRHQERTHAGLLQRLELGIPPVIHLVRFPQLTINHGMMIFSARQSAGQTRFETYDPNDPTKPAIITFERAAATFSMPGNLYWEGGKLDIIEIFRGVSS